MSTIEGTSVAAAARAIALARVERSFPSPSFLELFLTEQCNLQCGYCFVKAKTSRQMTTDVAERAVDVLLRISRGVSDVGILFFGGEPMLRFDLIQHVTEYANRRAAEQRKSVNYSMTTNGTIAREDQLEFLRSRGVRYLISIDGLKDAHDAGRRYSNGRGSFDTILGKLPIFKRYQPWLGARYTVTPQGVGDLAKGMRFLFDRGINQFIVGPAHGVPWTDDDLVTYERSLEEVAEWYVEMRRHDAPLRVSVFDDEDRSNGWGCGAGRGRLSVTASGDIYGCSKLVTVNGLEREGLYRYGDVFRGVIDWKQRAELVDGSGARRTECVPCAYRDECSGGCPAVNYEARGSAFLPDRFFCALVPITSRVQARVRNELASGEQPDASGVEDVSCRAATDHTESSLSDLDTGNGVRGRSVESSLPMEV